MANLFFTSDHHFFHKNILKFQADSGTRPCETVEEMNEKLVDEHNKIVKADDVVWFLGDLSFGDLPQTLELVSRMKGKKSIVTGNHDTLIRKNRHEFSEIFDFIGTEYMLRSGKSKIFLHHAPFRFWYECHYGAYHLYGHLHGAMDSVEYGRSMDVGIDTRSGAMNPWNWEEIYEKLKDRPIIGKF